MSAGRSEAGRFDRVAKLRETMSSAAEAHFREAELHVSQVQTQEDRIVRQIEHTRAEIAQPQGLSGHDIQQNERYVSALKKQRQIILQSLETAKAKAAEKHQDWIEARREQKIVERLRERRLQQWARREQAERQKSDDDAFIGKVIRARSTG